MKEALQTQSEVIRSKRHFNLTSSNFQGENRENWTCRLICCHEARRSATPSDDARDKPNRIHTSRHRFADRPFSGKLLRRIICAWCYWQCWEERSVLPAPVTDCSSCNMRGRQLGAQAKAEGAWGASCLG